jgi:hypothetical protein
MELSRGQSCNSPNKLIPVVSSHSYSQTAALESEAVKPAENALQDAWTGLALTKTVKTKQQQASQGEMSRNNAHRRAVF